MKKLCHILFLIFLTICSTAVVRADLSPEAADLSSSAGTVVFDLSTERQEYVFIDHEGLPTRITILNRGSEHIISMTNAKISLSFKIYVSGSTITNAYDGTYSSSYWNITPVSLLVDSSTQATYTVNCKRLLISTQRYLRANLVDGSIVVSHN